MLFAPALADRAILPKAWGSSYFFNRICQQRTFANALFLRFGDAYIAGDNSMANIRPRQKPLNRRTTGAPYPPKIARLLRQPCERVRQGQLGQLGIYGMESLDQKLAL